MTCYYSFLLLIEKGDLMMLPLLFSSIWCCCSLVVWPGVVSRMDRDVCCNLKSKWPSGAMFVCGCVWITFSTARRSNVAASIHKASLSFKTTNWCDQAYLVSMLWCKVTFFVAAPRVCCCRRRALCTWMWRYVHWFWKEAGKVRQFLNTNTASFLNAIWVRSDGRVNNKNSCI